MTHTCDHARDLQARLDAALAGLAQAIGVLGAVAPGYARLLGSDGLADDFEARLAAIRGLRDRALGEG